MNKTAIATASFQRKPYAKPRFKVVEIMRSSNACSARPRLQRAHHGDQRVCPRPQNSFCGLFLSLSINKNSIRKGAVFIMS